MPSQTHPQAQFVPISPEFDLNALVDTASNFDYVTRLSMEKLKEHSIQSFEALVLAVVIQSGKPLVIEGWDSVLPPWLFSRKWLEENLDTKAERVRDISNGVDIPMTVGHYLRSMEQLTAAFKKGYRDPKRQRLYLKDIDCPGAWADHLKDTIPECVYYLNDCIEARKGGDGAIREPNEYGQMQYGKGVAPAGDLMASLPPEMRAQNMMCYIGHEGTYTPSHREMCASLGHNIMVETSKDGNGERAGSSIWFMTETKERELVSEYFLSMLGHDIEIEKHFAQVNAWKKAPFNVWVVEQKVGDLILIPPLAPHQVWNRGTRTMKAAWNRTTVDTLELALHEALPRSRIVCREEQYKCKAIIYYTLINYYELLQRDTIEPKMWKYGRVKQLLDDFKRLFALYQEVLISEMFSPRLPEETDVEMIPYESFITCSYCRCNIFNRFLTCKSCILYGPNEEEDTYDVCMDCYAMGRSCACISSLTWAEQWDWSVLLQNYERWRGVVVQADGFFDNMRSPQPLEVARKRFGKKPIAEVCQEQLRLRPWNDINKPQEDAPDVGMSDDEPETNENGHAKIRKGGRKSNFTKNGKGRVIKTKGKTSGCHVCFHQEWNWKLAFCTSCTQAYCYGVLWRAFDLMPQTVMEDKEWQCPRCLKMCSCAKCRKGGKQIPYKPKGTLLGHDTKKVADQRSVESLVDFSKANLGWLRDETDNPQDSTRMKKLKEKAEADKAKDDIVDEGVLGNGVRDVPIADNELNEHDQSMQDIDPELRGSAPTSFRENGNGDYRNSFEPSFMPNGEHDFDFNGESSQAWMDAHFEMPNENHAEAPAHPQMTAAVAPMLAAEPSYPEPSYFGQQRMMGIGYYHQGNGADRILYDAPDENSGFEEDPSHLLIPPPNPNMAMSDLLDPAIQKQESNAKKRRKIGTGEGEDDVEFFTSKRQKLKAEAKYRQEPDEVQITSRTEKRPPRRSTHKPRKYVDLGEDAVPIWEDEAESIPRKPRKERSESDLDTLAAQAVKRLARTKAKAEAPNMRKSMRGQSSASPAARNTIKTPRRSAWLARKEAENAKNEDPEEISKRARRQRVMGTEGNTATSTISISSGGEDDHDESHDESHDDTNSLFDEPVGEQHVDDVGASDEIVVGNSIVDQGDAEISWRPSAEHPNVEVAEPSNGGWNSVNKQVPAANRTSQADVQIGGMEGAEPAEPAPVKRGRGRPRKSDITTTKKSEVSSAAPQSEPKRGRGRPKKQIAHGEAHAARTEPTQPTRIFSLKEKLTMKGKSGQIVAPREASADPSSALGNGRNTPIVSAPKQQSMGALSRSTSRSNPVSTLAADADEEVQITTALSNRPSARNSPSTSDIQAKSMSEIQRDAESILHQSVTNSRVPSVSIQPAITSPTPSISSPMGWNSANGKSAPSSLVDSPIVTPAAPANASRPASMHTPVPMPVSSPKKKGPTVVRLMSAESEFASQGSISEKSASSIGDDSSSDDDDASIHATVSPFRNPAGRGGLTRGRGATRGRGGQSARRGRPPGVLP